MAQGHLYVDTFGFYVDTDDLEAASADFDVVHGELLVAAGEGSVGMGELAADVSLVEAGAGGFEAGLIDAGVEFSTRCVLFVDSGARVRAGFFAVFGGINPSRPGQAGRMLLGSLPVQSRRDDRP